MLKTIGCLVVLACIVTCIAWGQCPDWSPYFDQIDDPTAVQQLQAQKSQGWPSFNPANNGGASLQQSIAQGDQLIAKIKQQMQQSYQSWAATRASNAQSINISHAECQNAGNANAAAACLYHNYQNQLLTVQGLNDLMRCRAGMPQGVYNAIPSAAAGGSGGDFGAVTPGGMASYQQGANSVADLNVAKRGGLVGSALRNWQAPTEQQPSTTSLAQNTVLADPFAVGADSSPDPGNGGGGKSTIDADNTGTAKDSQWTDPLASDPSTQPAQGDVAPSDPTPSQQEIAKTLDQGTAMAASTEVSATPVAQVAGASNWNQFTDSGDAGNSTGLSAITVNQATDLALSASSPTANGDAVDEQLNNDREIIDKDKKALKSLGVFNTNEASDQIMDQGQEVIFAVAHQGNHLINDLQGAMQGDLPPSQADSDLNALPQVMFDAATPQSVKSLQKDYNNLQQGANNVNNWVQAKATYFYNIITGNSQCNDQFSQMLNPDPACKH